MTFDSLAYLFFVGFFAIFAVAVVVGLLRWLLRINDMVRNQERIIEELQRINGQSSSNNPN